ncbi:MAG TPA: ATP-dependent helicase HrpB [Caulobacterales bacterium]|nr:ATP-dependent helicase HrpB [Caulobacterales bacterium]
MLPVDAVLPELRAALETRTEAVLVAPPGAGKTTRVPPALIEAPWAAGKVLLLSPRRIAARAAAARMAAERDEQVGDTIGYRVRLDARSGPKTRIEVITEGVFTRMILGDPELRGVSAVVFDEFHERSLEGDLGLALARDAQSGLRPDLRLLVMSATLDVARVASLLADAPIVECTGRMFPVELRYRPRAAHAALEKHVAASVRQALNEPGSALVFLPGAREIERTAELLRAELRDPDVDVRPLYGAMSAADQDAAIAPSPEGRRKVVLATSIAETSLTIEGVRIVVDSGLTRRARFEPAIGLSRLETVRASQAAVEQRRGRAGRLAPGVCWRLWSEGETRALPPFDRPEMLDADLSALALDLAAWGVRDPAVLTWLDPPPRAAWEQAVAGLTRIGAIDAEGRLTDHGRALSRLALPPRLAHMVVAAKAGGETRLAAHLSVLLTEQGLGGRSVDVRERLQGMLRDRSERARAARALADRVAGQAGGGGESIDAERAGAVLAYAYPERVAKARGGAFLLANGRAASLDPAEPLAREHYLVVAETAGAADRARILAAAPIALADIEREFAGAIEQGARVAVDPASGAVRARRTRRLGAIVLSEGPLENVEAADIEQALLDTVRDNGLSVLEWDDAATQLRARVALLRSLDGEIWPDWSDEALTAALPQWLAPALGGAKRLADVGVAQALAASLPHALRRRLDEAAPARFDTPAGSALTIDYAADGGPALDVRLQELFGLTTHPSVADGRAPLTLRLLSPAHRPVQTTKDLPGFWRGSYAAVRADMRGRYPKHPWPEDPVAAAPTRRAKPRGS